MPTVKSERGYIIPAIDTHDTRYLSCAEQLRASILHWHPGAEVTIVTRDMLPYGDQGGFANDWQMWHVSPYRQTIKLEADMIMAGPCDHWWTLMEKLDVCISTGARNIYDQPSACRKYRQVFDVNNLPDVYNAITYWRLSPTAQEFWTWVRRIFEQWNQFKNLIKFPDEHPSTDLVYAIAAQIMGPEQVTQPWASYPQIVHMKPGILPTVNADWTSEMIWEYDHTTGQLRFNTVGQWGAVHYHIKSWSIYG